MFISACAYTLAVFFNKLERCNPWPHVANRHISISQLLSSWRHSHCDVIRYWAGTGNVHRYGRTYVRTDTLPRLIYKDTSSKICRYIDLSVSATARQLGGGPMRLSAHVSWHWPYRRTELICSQIDSGSYLSTRQTVTDRISVSHLSVAAWLNRNAVGRIS